MKVSMNGFRRNFHSDVHNLKRIAECILSEDGFYDTEDFKEAVNDMIRTSNVLNCIYSDKDHDFTEMSELEIEQL